MKTNNKPTDFIERRRPGTFMLCQANTEKLDDHTKILDIHTDLLKEAVDTNKYLANSHDQLNSRVGQLEKQNSELIKNSDTLIRLAKIDQDKQGFKRVITKYTKSFVQFSVFVGAISLITTNFETITQYIKSLIEK